MGDAKSKVYENLYNELWPKGSEVKVYKLAKLKEKKIKDFEGVKCIKNVEDNLLMKDEEFQNR